jgi:hypothetical protein
VITEEEFKDWQLHPVTQGLMKALEGRREAMRREWEGGSYADYTKDMTVLVNVGNLGTCKGLAFVHEMTYEQLITELSDD